MGLLITNFYTTIKVVSFVCFHHILMYYHQQNRFRRIPQLLSQKIDQLGFWAWLTQPDWLLVRASLCNAVRSTPIGRLCVQSCNQIWSVYLTDSLVVSPKTFRNKMVLPQNCHRPCSETKSSLLRSGGMGVRIWWHGGQSFWGVLLFDKSGPGANCVWDWLRFVIDYVNRLSNASRTIYHRHTVIIHTW